MDIYAFKNILISVMGIFGIVLIIIDCLMIIHKIRKEKKSETEALSRETSQVMEEFYNLLKPGIAGFAIMINIPLIEKIIG